MEGGGYGRRYLPHNYRVTRCFWVEKSVMSAKEIGNFQLHSLPYSVRQCEFTFERGFMVERIASDASAR